MTQSPVQPRIRGALAQMRTQEIVYIARKCAQYPDAISLCFGESDLPTPELVRQALITAMNAGHTKYADRRGVAPLREAIVEYHQRTHAATLTADQFTATSSGMSAIMVALQCLVEPGDNVIVVAPIWPNIVIAIEAMGATVRFVGLDETDGTWSLNLEQIESQLDSRTRAVFVASPNNPTGWIMSSEQQTELLEITRRSGVWIISDEVYNRLVYDGSVASPSFLEVAEPEDSLFIVQSCSKTWSMTGWRLGWLIHPASIAHQVGNLSAINSTGSATFIQHAGAAAMMQAEPFVAELRERCQQGRSLVTQALTGQPRITVAEPPASFYSFIRISDADNCLKFAEDLVARAGVGIAPGTAFGPDYTEYFRICFAQDPARLETALDRLVSAL